VNCTVVVSSLPVLATTIAAGGQSGFEVDVHRTSDDAISFTIDIASNDDDENPYTFDVNIPPKHSPNFGVALTDGGPDIDANKPAHFTFTITNLGDADLVISAGRLDNEDNVSGALDASPSTTLAAGGTTTVTATVLPGSAGTYSFDLVVESNDPDSPVKHT